MWRRLDALCSAAALAITAASCNLLLPYQPTADEDGGGGDARLGHGAPSPDTRRDAAPPDRVPGDRTSADGRDGVVPTTDRAAAPDGDARDGLPPAPDLGDGGAIAGIWITVPAGSFTMGSPAAELCRFYNEDQHDVQLRNAFEIAATEVTQDRFAALMGYNPSYHSAGGGGPSCGPGCPVESVSWHEAAAYCNVLSNAAKLAPCYECSGSGASVSCQEAVSYSAAQVYACPGYRLPTEAEWERAYRAGTQTALSSGPLTTSKCDDCTVNDPSADLVAWYCANASSAPQPVAGKQANAWGLFDMAGNVWEWCHDRYEELLGTTPVIDPWGSPSALTRVARGGSYINPAQRIRAASRLDHSPTDRQRWRGFRCARTK